MIDPELHKILQEQSDRLTAIETRLAKIQSHMRWSAISSWLRIVLIIVPLIIGYIILSPLVNTLMEQYQQILSVSGSEGFDINSYLPR